MILANELGIPYQSIAMVTDYDCWEKTKNQYRLNWFLKEWKKMQIK